MLDQINENFTPQGCLTLWARAFWHHNDVLYGVVVFSTLESPERDTDVFDRVLSTFEYA